MYNSDSINVNDENIERQLSQEYTAMAYCDMQPVPLPSPAQSTVDITRRKSIFCVFIVL